MQQESPRKRWMLVASVLLVAPLLSGCFGGDDAPKSSGDELGDNIKVSETGGKTNRTVSDKTDHSGAKNEPSAHFHHYWGKPPIDQVYIYNGKVEFNNWDPKYRENYNALAYAEFNLETDNNDVADPSNDDPINLDEGGIADTVFAGANRIVVQFPQTFPPGVSQMLFFYKASNTPIYMPENGMEVLPGSVVEIKLNEVGMTDPPHQFTASRWSFRLIPYNALCTEFNLEGETCPPTVISDTDQPPDPTGQGSTYVWGERSDDCSKGLCMIAYNGGVESLDPPHPDFWKGADSIHLSGAGGTIADPAVQTPVVREQISSMTDIAMEPNKIVPMGTEYLQVRVSWSNTAQTEQAAKTYLRLYYHGANDIKYVLAENGEADGDSAMIYKIYDPDETLVDPPYESNSFWRFKLVPTVDDPSGQPVEKAGVFQGDWDMEFTAFKKPGFVLE